MPTTADTAKLLKLKAEIEGKSPGDRLRVAAALIDRGEPGLLAIAETLASNVVDELRLVRMLRK